MPAGLTIEQKALLGIQDIDLKIAGLEARLANAEYKQHIAAARAKLAEGERRLTGISAAISDLDKQITNLQDHVDNTVAKQSAEQAKIEHSRDHREVDALSHELETLAKRKEQLETEELDLLEKKQSFTEARIDTDVKMNRLREIEAEQLGAYKAFYQKVSAAKAELLSQRETYAGALAPATLKRYDSLREAKGGFAVARYHEGVCEGCSMAVPTSARGAIEDGEDISACPNCKRLLIVEPSPDDE
jgi:predicted  nucleic acid-binding Zn-ribbon protein